MIIQIWTD